MVANLKMIERRKTGEMNAVGIDVSKGKSTVVVMRPFGEVVAEPFEVSHTDAELSELACFLGKLPGETRIVMEYTGNYWQPIAKVLYSAVNLQIRQQRFNMRCSHWLHSFQSIQSSCGCSVSVLYSVHNSWRRSVTCAALTASNP